MKCLVCPNLAGVVPVCFECFVLAPPSMRRAYAMERDHDTREKFLQALANVAREVRANRAVVSPVNRMVVPESTR